MDRIGKLKNWYGRAALISFLMLPAGGVLMALIMPTRVCGQGRCEPETPFAKLLVDIGTAGACVLIFALIFFALRYVRIRKVTQFGFQSWSVSSLKQSRAATAALNIEMSKLDDATLLAAANHPDHSVAGRAVCADMLAGRNMTPAKIAAWQPPPDTLRVPTFLKNGGTTQIAARKTRAFKVFSQAVRLLGLCAALVGILFFGGLLLRAPAFLITTLFVALLLLFFVILLLGSAWLRGRTLRILLLRPFGERRMTAALKKVVLYDLGALGHVVTLSDRNYRPNPFMPLLNIFGDFTRYIVSPVLHPSLRIASVRNEMGFFKLAETLSKKLKPSFRSLIAGGQAVNIRSTDAWWMRCIDLLMHSTDFIVMDISRVSTGSAWEIEQLGRRGLLDRCIFIVQESYQAEGLASIAAFCLPVSSRTFTCSAILAPSLNPVPSTRHCNGRYLSNRR